MCSSLIRLLFSALLVLCSCKNAQDVFVPTDVKSWDSNQDFQTAMRALSEEDKKLMAAYGIRMQADGAGVLPGTTIADALKSQREWTANTTKSEQDKQAQEKKLEDDRKALAAKAEADRAAKTKEMNEAVTVAVTRMEFLPKNFQEDRFSDMILVNIAFDNKTEKAITGIKGVIVFKDIFGDLIKNINLSYDEGVKARSTATWDGTIKLNQFDGDDQKLAQTPMDKLKIEWKPEVYLFADGASLKSE